MRRIAVAVGAVAVSILMGGSSPAEEARKAVRLLAEAEDFTVKTEGWKAVPFRENYFASTFAVSFLSRMGCLGAPEQLPAGKPAIAEQGVQIPYDDAYEVLARYEQPYNFSAEFTIEIEQGGKVVYRELFGRLQDPKIWALNGNKDEAMCRYWWGGTDNIVWQRVKSAGLAAGPATLRLIAAAQVDSTQTSGDRLRLNAGRRNVDILCLTNDRAGIEAQRKASYLEFDGWLVQEGDLFMRVTNPKDGLGPCVPVIAPFPAGQHSPYYVHVRDWPSAKVLKSGRLEDPTSYVLAGPRSQAVRPDVLAPRVDPSKFIPPPDPKNPKAKPAPVIPDTEYLQPGETSGWVPMGHLVDALHNSQWAPGALYKGKAEGLHLRLEFAVPDGKGGLKTIKDVTVKGKPGYSSPATFEIPGNVAPSEEMARTLKERWWLPRIRTQKEALDWLTAEVAKFPRRGSTPKRFLIYHILGFSGALDAFPEARQLALALGDNTAVGQEGKRRRLVAHWGNPDLKWIQGQEAKEPNGFSDLLVVSYGDEIHLPTAPVKDEEFAAWLQARGVGVDGPVKYDAKDRTHPLYYYSVICGVEAGAKPYAAASAYYKSKGALTGANYSPHANYLVTEMHYIRPFKLQALTMAWSEDYVWQIPEFSVQVTGYLASAFRAGTRYHGQPIMMYVMPHSPGNTPGDFRRSFYTCLAHGMTMVNYFCASPLAVGGTENYVATDDLAMWREIYTVSHEAGIFEDYVMDGKVRPARVGLLLSSVDDILTGATNASFAMHNNERKAIYYALRHSQVPVDFLSEDDVIDGLAKDYPLIYVTQQWLHSKAVQALTKWVEKGGTLVALCGGGLKNEFNRDNPEAAALYGVKTQHIETDPQLVRRYLQEENRPFLTKQDLPLYEPMEYASWTSDDVTLPGASDPRGVKRIRDVPVMVWRQRIEPSDGTVLGAFRDGRPAVVAKAHGKGTAYLFGFLPGQAYLKSGLPILPPDRGSTDAAFAHYLPTTMDVNLRMRLVDDFLPGRLVDEGGRRRWVCSLRPVQCSVDLVESACIDTPAMGGNPARLAVPLINYTGKPIERLTVRIEGVAKASSVRSVERGPLTPRFDGGAMTVELPLDIADALLINR